MKILARRDNLSIFVNPGDTFKLLYTPPGGETRTVLSHEIESAMRIDTALVIETEDGELGLECGIGGVFGKKKGA